MSDPDELSALNVISAYINSHDGMMPTHHNQLVSFSCNEADLPTLDDRQASNIISIYQTNLNRVRAHKSNNNSPNNQQQQHTYSSDSGYTKDDSTHSSSTNQQNYTDTNTDDTSSSDEKRSLKKHKRPGNKRIQYRNYKEKPHKKHHTKEQRYQRTHLTTETIPIDRNINYNQQKPPIKQPDKYRYKGRGDMPQHIGYSERTQRDNRYHRKDNKNNDNDIELQIPHYNESSDTQSKESTTLYSSTVSHEEAPRPDVYNIEKGLHIKKDMYTSPNRNTKRERVHTSSHIYSAKTTEIEMEAIPGNVMKPLDLSHDVQKEVKVKNPSVHTEKDDGEQKDASQNDMESKIKDYTFCMTVSLIIVASICCIGVILAIILIPLSIRKIEFDEYALKYNDLTKEVHNEPYSEGRYVFTPQTKLFKYDNIIQTLDLNLECLTKDGILIGINVTIQYSIPENNLNKIWNEYGIEGNLYDYSRLVSSAAIRDGVSAYNAASFYLDRYDVQNRIETYLYNAFEYSNTYLDITSAILTGYSFPQLLKETIGIKRNAENDIEIAKNERDGNLTDASKKLSIAKIYAKQLLISGEAEHESILAEANEKSEMIKNMFEYRRELMFNVMQRMNMSAIQFIDEWLSAHVLLNANHPITTTK